MNFSINDDMVKNDLDIQEYDLRQRITQRKAKRHTEFWSDKKRELRTNEASFRAGTFLSKSNLNFDLIEEDLLNERDSGLEKAKAD